MKIVYIFLLFFIGLIPIAKSQNSDTLYLTFPNFLSTVIAHHPVAKQALLYIQSADALSLSVKGAFDPRLFYSFDQKLFNNTNYWTLQNGGLRVPTWIGLDITTGIEHSNGSYLNNESITAKNGLLYSQISLPLLQGLLIDERRFALKQASLFRDYTLIDQKNIYNELLSKSSKAYWDWVQAYHNFEVLKEGILLSSIRLEGIKQAARIGEMAEMDTLEASIQFQDRYVNLKQMEVDFFSKTMMLTTFLWNENNEPAIFTVPVIPPPSNDMKTWQVSDSFLLKIDSLIQIHPVLLAYDNKNRRLDWELQLKKDKLKPVLHVKFNPLYDVNNLNSSVLYGVNSYKWGMGFQFPLLLRKERGEIKLTQIKIADLNFEIKYKKNEIRNKIRASVNEYNTLMIQITLANSMVQNYLKLLQAERKLFEIGESSVFMVNNRELSYINAKIKLNDLLYKYRKAGVELLYNSGQFYNLP